MSLSKISLFALLSLYAIGSLGKAEVKPDVQEPLEAPSTTPNLSVSIKTTFPSAEIFGVKLINGRPNQSHLSITNNEASPITVTFVGGSLTHPPSGQIIRNLTAVKYAVSIPAGAKESLSYSFSTITPPGPYTLKLSAAVTDGKGDVYTVEGFNEKVDMVEPETSIFDPQIIFLYLVLLSLLSGVSYFVYSTWIATLFPQKRGLRGGKGGERAKKSSMGSKQVDAGDGIEVVGADGPAVASGSGKGWDESWIPEGHIKRPDARRVKSGKR